MLVVLGTHGDVALRAIHGDVGRLFGQAERIGQRGEMELDAVVGNLRRETNFLPHGVLELVEAPVRLTDVDAEVQRGGNEQECKQTAERAHGRDDFTNAIALPRRCR